MGGNTQWMEGRCFYRPDEDGSGQGSLEFNLGWRLFDRYNWDGGKSVTIGGVRVNDEVLGRLHVVGLAREYDIVGHRTERVEVPFVGQRPGEGSDDHVPEVGGERTGRDDPGRERA